MTAAQALRRAEKEGLPLVKSKVRRSGKAATPYLCVNWVASHQKYELKIPGTGTVGYFATSEEAALNYARRLGKELASEKGLLTPADLASRAATAKAQAAAEGLPLITAKRGRGVASSTGYKGVRANGSKFCVVVGKKAQIRHRVGGSVDEETIGSFLTAEEGALAYARHLGKEAAWAQYAKKDSDAPSMSAADAVRIAKKEGLQLWTAGEARINGRLMQKTNTGYSGVTYNEGYGSRPYCSRFHGELIGTFATAEEAALEWSRHATPVLKEQEQRDEAMRAANPDKAAEIVRKAQEEGLPLIRSENRPGWLYVNRWKNGKFSASIPGEDGTRRYLGTFATAEEAAYAAASTLGCEAMLKLANMESPPLSDDDADRQAAVEGLVLVPSASNAAGFLNVSTQKEKFAWKSSGEFGTCATAKMAALEVARRLGSKRSAAEAAIQRRRQNPMTAEEALAQAESEGLRLWVAPSNMWGYTGVSRPGRRFQATVRTGDKVRTIGCYETAEEAALNYAREVGSMPQRPHVMTADEAKAQAATLGVTLHSASNACGYLGVHRQGTKFVATVKQRYIGSFCTAEEAALQIALAVKNGDLSHPRKRRFAAVVGDSDDDANGEDEEDTDEEKEESVEETEETAEVACGLHRTRRQRGEDPGPGLPALMSIADARKRRAGSAGSSSIVCAATRHMASEPRTAGQLLGPSSTVAAPSPCVNPPIHSRVRVCWKRTGCSYDGLVVDARSEIGSHGMQYRFQVAYDDGTTSWHLEADDTSGILLLPRLNCEDAAPVSAWQALNLRCAISFGRLVDPAKGDACKHLSFCNYTSLRHHFNAGHRHCPIAGCDATLRRSRDLIRDERLAAQLRTVREGVDTVWLSTTGEIRTTNPEQLSATVRMSGQAIAL